MSPFCPWLIFSGLSVGPTVLGKKQQTAILDIQSGREGMIAGWKQYFLMFPDYEIRVENILEDENLVAIFGSAFGTYNGKRGLVPENKIEMPAAWRAVVENGKIKFWQVYADWTEGTRIIKEDSEQAAQVKSIGASGV